MFSSLASGVLALVRIKYVDLIFPPGVEQDAYRAAFTLPNLINYFLIGGAASISLITVLNRYREAGDDEGGDRALSVILTTMLLVLGAGIVLGEIFAPQYVWLANEGFRTDAIRSSLCVALTRLILPAQLFFFIGSVMSSRLQVRRIFIYQAFTPLIYNAGSFSARCYCIASWASSRWRGVCSPGCRGLCAAQLVGRVPHRSAVSAHCRVRRSGISRVAQALSALMIGVSLVMFDDIFLKYFGSIQPAESR